MNKLEIFQKRLSKIGINIVFWSNYPWVYIDTINGKKVIEKFQAEHGFTVLFRQTRFDNKDEFTNISEIFKLIRQYVNSK